PYSILFRGCSFLTIYEAGVFSALKELCPDILKNASKIYGSSSGSIVTTAGLCGCDPGKHWALLFILRTNRRKCYTKTSCQFSPISPQILKNLKFVLDKYLPPNAHELVSGKLHIVLTRVHDWKCVTVSEFASKEDLIQAVLCSCYIPVYFGFIPPTYQGVRYVDGELAMWKADFVTRSTITVSAFAGEYDICPKDGPAAFFNFQLSDCILQISKRNLCRLQHI
ncbi:PLPL1 protein, partial [Scytalopus superciliaris]|nr:PLPL1 protein [Scytalopus superciliaris]